MAITPAQLVTALTAQLGTVGAGSIAISAAGGGIGDGNYVAASCAVCSFAIIYMPLGTACAWLELLKSFNFGGKPITALQAWNYLLGLSGYITSLTPIATVVSLINAALTTLGATDITVVDAATPSNPSISVTWTGASGTTVVAPEATTAATWYQDLLAAITNPGSMTSAAAWALLLSIPGYTITTPAPPTPGYHISSGNIQVGTVANQYTAFVLGNNDSGSAAHVFAWDNTNQWANCGQIDAVSSGESGLAVDAANNVMYSQVAGLDINETLTVNSAKVVSGSSSSAPAAFAPPTSKTYAGHSGAADSEFQYQTTVLSADRATLYALCNDTSFATIQVVKINLTSGSIVATSALFTSQDTGKFLFLSPDGTKVVTGGYGTADAQHIQAIVLNSSDLSTAHQTQQALTNFPSVVGAALSPDGSTLAITTDDGGSPNVCKCSIFNVSAGTFSAPFTVGNDTTVSGAITFPKGDNSHVLIYLNGSLLTFTTGGVAGTVYNLAIPGDTGANSIATEPNSGLIYGASLGSGGDNILWCYDTVHSTLLTHQVATGSADGNLNSVCFAT